MITVTATEGIHSRTSREHVDAPLVFVVDDDVSVRESLEGMIEASGWQPETFASARAT